MTPHLRSQVFADRSGCRQKYLRRTFGLGALAGITLLTAFSARMLRTYPLPEILLPAQHRPFHPLKAEAQKTASTADEKEPPAAASPRPIALNHQPGTGLRAAFYVPWDAASYSSLQRYASQIDVLFPEWLHVLEPDGHLQTLWNAVEETDTTKEHFVDVIQRGRARLFDDNVMSLLATGRLPSQVMPMVNNFDPLQRRWLPEVSQFFADARARARFRREILAFLQTNAYAGLTLDFEEFPSRANQAYVVLVKELKADLHARDLQLYVAVPATDEDYPYAEVAADADRIILMNDDQHSPVDTPGPIASQDWSSANLRATLAVVPPEKLISTIGNYGYDWTFEEPAEEGEEEGGVLKEVRSISTPAAWLAAWESGAHIEFDAQALNPHLAFREEPNLRHEIWFTDAVTALNQMRAAQRLGVNNFALWCLGTEDRSLWSIWQHPEDADAPSRIQQVPPGSEVERDGQGEILHIRARPSPGTRRLQLDSGGALVVQEELQRLPTPYEVSHLGSVPGQVALTFDDGPNPEWTPQILNVLEAEHVPAAFFMVGSQAIRYPALVRRVYNAGHEIGNHTWSHPDISSISEQRMRMELNMTERFFAAQLGIKPLLFRPPYSISEDAETAEQILPIDIAQQLGYIPVGDNIDPRDWEPSPKPSAEQITARVMARLPEGKIVVLHDGGGDRHETVRALPMIIHQLRAQGYTIVPVRQLLGKSAAEVMPPDRHERWSRYLDTFGFGTYALVGSGLVLIFFVGDILMSARLLVVGTLAVFNRLRRRLPLAAPGFRPPVAVLIPAYNEEKVIVGTVRSVLNSEYPELRVIVIDDGSTDSTLARVRAAFGADPRVIVLTKPNGGKASALNYGMQHVREQIFFGLDADTHLDAGAIALLVPHFADPEVAAVAGNVKVGNRHNLWTRWQALEYVTIQNLERRALDVLRAVTVVPGALGGWRTAAVRQAGGYQPDTVAEDADLTMALLRVGYRVEYEDRALAYTEAPADMISLMRQRLRWSFGILQSVWKHRAVFTRKGALGWIGLPNIVLFQMLLPLVSPLVDLVFLFGLAEGLLQLRFHVHPEAANYGDLERLAVLFVAFLFIDFLTAALAFLLERGRVQQRESFRLLWHICWQRFAYRQLLSLVVLRTLQRAAEGRALSWGKLERHAAVLYVRPEPGVVRVAKSSSEAA
jgi:cellulose synthase/poly-beta-1,6-N-acetylglucosamine synthase-like glycosyltransferase/peptidoglycan/xylan/chitin deacetylase (PgdA/CDA1 family)/spore germination protein YaaH